MKKVVVVCSLMVLVAGSAFGWGIPKLGGEAKSDAPAASLEDAIKAQKDLVSAYAEGAKLNYQAQGLMAGALGLKEEAAKYETAAKSAGTGNFQDMEAAQANTKDMSKVILEKMTSGESLSSDAKKQLAASLIPMAGSIVSYKNAASKAKGALESAKSVISNAPMTEKASAKKQLDPVLTIAPKVPGDVTEVAATAKKYIEFCKSAGVEPPSDLTKALGDL